MYAATAVAERLVERQQNEQPKNLYLQEHFIA